MTKTKMQPALNLDSDDNEALGSKRIPGIENLSSMTQNTFELLSEGLGTGLNMWNGFTNQWANQLSGIAESTESLMFNTRLLRESVDSYEKLSKIWLQHVLSSIVSSIDHSRTLSDKSGENLRALVRIVKTDK